MEVDAFWFILYRSDMLLFASLQTPKAFEVKADLPGVDKKDVKVNVDGDVLSLSVEKSAGTEEKKDEDGIKYHRYARSPAYNILQAFLEDNCRQPSQAGCI